MKSKLSSTEFASFFSSGFHLEGNITTENDIRIEGEIIGNIKSNKKIIIGENGKVVGNVEADHIVLLGEVKGRIIALNKVDIGKNAFFQGMAYTNNIQVDKGAKMEAGIQKLSKKAVGESIQLPFDTDSILDHTHKNTTKPKDQNLDSAIASVS